MVQPLAEPMKTLLSSHFVTSVFPRIFENVSAPEIGTYLSEEQVYNYYQLQGKQTTFVSYKIENVKIMFLKHRKGSLVIGNRLGTKMIVKKLYFQTQM